MAAIPPARSPARSRGSSSHQQQSSQPPQQLYSQPQGFSSDVTTYDMISGASSFQPSTNPPGYSQYFAQQVKFSYNFCFPLLTILATLQLIPSASTALRSRSGKWCFTKSRHTTNGRSRRQRPRPPAILAVISSLNPESFSNKRACCAGLISVSWSQWHSGVLGGISFESGRRFLNW